MEKIEYVSKYVRSCVSRTFCHSRLFSLGLFSKPPTIATMLSFPDCCIDFCYHQNEAVDRYFQISAHFFDELLPKKNKKKLPYMLEAWKARDPEEQKGAFWKYINNSVPFKTVPLFVKSPRDCWKT